MNTFVKPRPPRARGTTSTPLYFRVNFRGKTFRERGVNHENIVPRKFGAIRYLCLSLSLSLTLSSSFFSLPPSLSPSHPTLLFFLSPSSRSLSLRFNHNFLKRIQTRPLCRTSNNWSSDSNKCTPLSYPPFSKPFSFLSVLAHFSRYTFLCIL